MESTQSPISYHEFASNVDAVIQHVSLMSVVERDSPSTPHRKRYDFRLYPNSGRLSDRKPAQHAPASVLQTMGDRDFPPSGLVAYFKRNEAEQMTFINVAT